MSGQFFAPWIDTSSITLMSSSSFHGFLETRPESLVSRLAAGLRRLTGLVAAGGAAVSVEIVTG